METSRLAPQAVTILEKRCLKKNAKGQVVESPEEMFWRLDQNFAKALRSI
jgi:ribonucleotide reductase alpha subunit